MAKIAVITDSNSGITQKEAKELGVFVIPMPFLINDETYFEDINLTQEDFYEKLKQNATVSTSQPSPETVMNLWDDVLKEYDQIVHIPMSSGLSGSCQSAMMLAQDYEDKVFVVNNQRISITQRRSVFDALTLVQKGLDGAAIKQRLEDEKFNSSIYIMLDTLSYLKKGGRITPAAAAIGTLLKIKPVLQIQGEKLDAFAKARTTAQGKNIMITAATNDVMKRFGGMEEKDSICIDIAHSANEEAARAFQKEIQETLPGFESDICPLSLSVSCHIGPGSLAIALSKKVK